MQRKRLVAAILAVFQSAMPALSYAQTSGYSVQVPVTAVPFTPSLTRYDYGNVVVGQTAQHVFTFINRGSNPTTVYSVTNFGSATILSSDCVGAMLAAGQACSITGAIPVSQVGKFTGEFRVNHSMATIPDVFSVSATGVTAAGMLVPSTSLIDFGSASVTGVGATRSFVLQNKGTTAVQLKGATFLDNPESFSLVSTTCGATLAPGGTCNAVVSFKPSSAGVLQSRLAVTVGDGTQVSLVNLIGVGAQGVPTWDVSQLSFWNSIVGQKITQTVRLTNSGTGTLNVGSANISSNPAFSIENKTCPALLAPGASCQITVGLTAPNTNVQKGTLTLQTTSSSQPSLDLPLYAEPQAQKPVLTLSPAVLDFGQVAMNTTVGKPVTLLSTGNSPAQVSGYRITGPNASSFSLLAPQACTGSLASGNKCDVTVKVTGKVKGALTASLEAVTTNIQAPVAPVQLMANVFGGIVKVNNSILDFGTVTRGSVTTKEVPIYNQGAADAVITGIVYADNGATFKAVSPLPGNCAVGKTITKGGSSCTLSIAFNASTVGYRSSDIIIKTDAGDISITARGTSAEPVPPSAALSTFSCPSTVIRNQRFTCTSTVTNTGADIVTVQASGVTVDSPVFKDSYGVPQFTTTCSSNLGLKPGGGCAVTLTGTAQTEGTVTANVVIPVVRVSNATINSRTNLSATLTTGAQAPISKAALGGFTCSTPVVVGDYMSCSATLSSTGNQPLSISQVTSSNLNGLTLSHTCGSMISAGGTCTIRLEGTASKVGTLATDVVVKTNATTPVLTASMSANVLPVTASFQVAPHGLVSVGQSNTAVHTLTNTSQKAFRLTNTPTVTGTGFAYVSDDCGTSLQPGESCTMTTRCSPTTGGGMTGTILAPIAYANVSGTLTCSGALPSATLTPLGGTTTDVGGFARSGNWYKVTNTGLADLKLASITLSPKNTPFLLYTDQNDPLVCFAGKTLAPNQSCSVLVASDVAPGATQTAMLAITSPVNLVANIALKGYGVSITPRKGFAPKVQRGNTDTAEYVVTNNAPYTLKNINVLMATTTKLNPSTAGYSITATDCTTLEPKASCTVSLKLTSPTTSVLSITGLLTVKGTYPQVVNGIVGDYVGQFEEGTASIVTSMADPKLRFVAGSFPATTLGKPVTATHKVFNDGIAPVTFYANPVLSNSAYSVVSNGCMGTLQPGASCDIVTQFSASTSGNSTTTLTLDAPVTAVVGTLTSRVMPITDVSVTVTDNTDNSLPGGTGTWEIVTKNSDAGPVSVSVMFGAEAKGTNIVTTGVPSCSVSDNGASTCKVVGNTATMMLQAGASAKILQTLTYGPSEGTVTMTAGATYSDMVDTNPSNDRASDTTNIAYLKTGVISGGDSNVVSASWYGAQFVQADGSLAETGYNLTGQLATGNTKSVSTLITAPNLSNVVAVSGKWQHVAALKGDGSLWLAGYNAYGQLGFGTTADAYKFYRLTDSVVQVSAGATNTVFLKKDGTAWAMGDNKSYQLTTTSQAPYPLPRKLATNVKAVSTNGAFTLVLKTDGTVWGVGDNTCGQLGLGDYTNRYVLTKMYSGAKAISAGGCHTMILLTDGSVVAAGGNSHGQLGLGNLTNNRPVFGPVATDVAAISAGLAHSAIIKTDGSLHTVGASDVGQLGSGRTGNSTSFSRVIDGGVTSVSASATATIVTKSDGSVWAAGNMSFPSEAGFKSPYFLKLSQ